MWAELAFKALVWLGQRLPGRLRITLTRSPWATWLRGMSQLPRGGPVVLRLSGALAGYRMLLDMRAGHRRYALSAYEPEVAALIQSTLQRGETALDIGANIGYFTLLMAHRVGPTGYVIAFEPFPPVYAVLCENLQLNNLYWVRAECKAVADREGEILMQCQADNPLPFTASLSKGGDLTVPVTSVDHYTKLSGLTRLDLAKIDAEGAEDVVVRGMAKTLQAFHPVVLLEIHANDGGESEALGRLQAAGYSLRRVQGDGLTPCDTRAQGGHVLGMWRA